MMAFEPLDEEVYDSVATFITYAKLFPYMFDHFVTRKDAKQMMLPSNLPVNTTINVTPGQVVTTAGSPTAQTGSTVSPGSGTGSGTVQAAYDGSYAHAESQTLKVEVKAKKEAGGGTIEGFTEGVAAAAGE